MADLISMLSAASGATAEADPNFNSTVLLLHGDGTNGAQNNTFLDSSTNNFTITRNGNTTQGTFSPFSRSSGNLVNAPYDPAVHGGSGYFDGFGDYLTIADNTALDMEASNFTIECWFYPVVTPNQSICSKRASSSDFAGVNIYFSNSTTPKALASVNGTTWGVDMTSSININVGEWSHLALTRSSNTWTLWVNGVSGATATVSGTVPNNAGAFAVGSAAADGLFNLSQSHIASFRVVKGTALYSTTFTPPTSPLTAVANTSLLLNFTNAGIIDNTAKNNLETVGNAQIDTAVKKYGTGSVELDGDDYLVIRDDENLEFGAGDFTIEAFVRFAALPANNTSAGVITKWNASNLSYFAGAFNNAGTMQVAFFYSTNGSAQTNILANQTFSTGVWYHLAYVRNGSSFKIFVDGTEKTSSATISGTLFNGTQAVNIGRSGDGFNYLNGFIDELRVTKGVARYTANFTAPTKAFPDQ
jgi:hypothetical protein